ncbi:MAG: amidohydrolase family protein, partial [Candidatus Aegiribacteria sp.]|nr:amidohydrolase family protein [Candidatus Aegiribacteria sp.]MBD3295683.1 amidohydrolase family protein [Candidatus Fermentibacteria bacterium]
MVNNMGMDKTLHADGIVTANGFLNSPFRIRLENGSIDSIERCGSDKAETGCIALPGMVQAHAHLGQPLFRGMAENRTLLPWLEERIWPLEASHTPDTLAVSVIQGLKELFSSGCTALLDMGLVRGTEVIIDLLRRSGMRARAGNSLMDLGPDWITEDIPWLREESERIKASCGDLVEYVYVPRFALSCSEDIWKWMSNLSGSALKSTHASESRSELECKPIA